MNCTRVWYGPKYGCHSRELNSAIICFLYAHVQCISELCCKFQIPAFKSVGGVAETRTVVKSVTYVRMYVSTYVPDKGKTICPYPLPSGA